MNFSGSSTRRRLRTEETGSELVEFALTSVLLFIGIFGIISCSLALYADHFVAYAAREGARYAMVRGSSWGVACASYSSFNCSASTDNVDDYISNLAPPGISAKKLQIAVNTLGTTPGGATCSTTGTTGAGCVVQVTVSYSFVPFVPFVANNPFTMSSTSAVAISQ